MPSTAVAEDRILRVLSFAATLALNRLIAGGWPSAEKHVAGQVDEDQLVGLRDRGAIHQPADAGNARASTGVGSPAIDRLRPTPRGSPPARSTCSAARAAMNRIPAAMMSNHLVARLTVQERLMLGPAS